MPVWYEGDACRPADDDDHPVMFVYDFEARSNFSRAMCNWLEHGLMYRQTFDARDLVRACRKDAEH